MIAENQRKINSAATVRVFVARGIGLDRDESRTGFVLDGWCRRWSSASQLVVGKRACVRVCAGGVRGSAGASRKEFARTHARACAFAGDLKQKMENRKRVKDQTEMICRDAPPVCCLRRQRRLVWFWVMRVVMLCRRVGAVARYGLSWGGGRDARNGVGEGRECGGGSSDDAGDTGA